MRRLPPLMSEHPLGVQILLVVIVPAVYGAITGYFLGTSEAVYLVLSIVGVVGGVAAGFDHLGAKAGALRGIAAGSIFGGAILRESPIMIALHVKLVGRLLLLPQFHLAIDILLVAVAKNTE